LEKQLCEAFARGSTQRDACALAHLSLATFTYWMRKGETGHEDYVSFALHIRAAESRWSNKLLEDLQSAIDQGLETKGLQWLLEKRRWKDYDPRALLAHRAAKSAREAAKNANLAALNDSALHDQMIAALKGAAQNNEALRAKLAALSTEDEDDERLEDPSVPE